MDQQQQRAISINEFCNSYGCRSSWYNWQAKGLTPRTIKIGRRVFITQSALEEWEQSRATTQNAAQ